MTSFSWGRLRAVLVLLFVIVQVSASAQDQPIYTDALQNGWQSYGWATLDFGNPTPVHTGTASISVATNNYSALFLHHDSFSTIPYTALSFWINGGVTGGQHLQIQAHVNNAPLKAVPLPPLNPGEWKQITIDLGALGAANVSNMDGFWIQSNDGGVSPAFYVDDIKLVGAAIPSVVNLSVNANTSVRTVDNRIFGVNTAVWDSQLGNQATTDLLTASDNRALRFPGGSFSDAYHWKTGLLDGNSYLWPGTFDGFAANAVKTNAQVFITANYGSGTAQEAADWVAYSNVTKKYGFRYWEIGNENYGSWENDTNNLPHDPYTYATRAKDYIALMKGADPMIKVGVVVVTGEDGWGNSKDKPVINPRTGASHGGWTPVLLAHLKELNVIPDFVIYHRYDQGPGNENDAGLLQSSASWASDVANLRQMISDYLGASGRNTEIVCTENNSVSYNPGKQSTSLVNGLFMADSIGQALQTELGALIWWDFRNGQQTTYNNSSSLYGWRLYGDYGLVSGQNDPYPTYYMTKLLKSFARGGDNILSATSDYALLSVYAARRTSGDLTLLVINKSPNNTLKGDIALSGFVPTATAATVSYGIPQDDAARTGSGPSDIATGTLSVGTGFTTSFAPYSATVITLVPATRLAAPSNLSAVSNSLGKVSLTWKSNSTSQTGFQIERSSDGRTFTRITTLAANVVSTTDTGLTSRQQLWYRVRAISGTVTSPYSNIVTVRVR